MTHVNVNIHGQITLPAFIRKKHKIGTSTILEVADRDSEIVLKKAAVVEADIVNKLEALARKKKVTQKMLLKWCREARGKIYSECYG
ncbi:MAG: AbrB/MazE/SpoVT family DNA-binding domain-containing protein [Candidatus Diapherotrites archaeon]|uniref:AbrB/MazE/SpoVT family DNA-binding domain-containing protein n=1 Tax=Candidatus Iainarchaeum sp. TaxID=3101447 RepID=A0A8T4KRC0_9ARCH|nr:AbrB/MazE/SpoVT family DNA-binding domain-containing protein [Candidatus Diapherotrites archaeon]